MERHIPELEDLKNEIIKMRELINTKPVLTQEWYDLTKACKLKGVNKNTVSNKPKYQPAYGKEDAIICGKKRWNRDTIAGWLKETDEDIPAAYR